MARNLDSRKSIFGYLFTFVGETISWQSKLQRCVSSSTKEVKYIESIEVGKEILWMKYFLQELGLRQKDYIVYCDSQSVIASSKNTMYHARRNT